MRARIVGYLSMGVLLGLSALGGIFVDPVQGEIVNGPGSSGGIKGPPSLSVQGVPSWALDGVRTFGCDSYDITLDMTFSGLDGVGPYIQETVVRAGGLTYMHQKGNIVDTDGLAVWGIFADSTGGPVDGTFPIPPGETISMNFRLFDPSGRLVWCIDATLDGCDTGTIISNVSWACGGSLTVPTMTEWGIIIFVVLAGFSAIYYLRRKRIES